MTSEEKTKTIKELEDVKEILKVSENSYSIKIINRIIKRLQDDWNQSDWYYQQMMQELNL
jgi:predicted nucleic acid-binding OB-fold protein